MNCKHARRNISSWLDGELKDSQKAGLEAHLRGCVSCCGESNKLKTLCQVLREDTPLIEPSKNFNTVFWSKVSGRQNIPWFTRLLGDLEVFIPAPNLRQAVTFALLAFFIGNIGGLASMLPRQVFTGSSTASLRHFSNLQEFKGLPSYSLAASYLKITEKGTSE